MNAHNLYQSFTNSHIGQEAISDIQEFISFDLMTRAQAYAHILGHFKDWALRDTPYHGYRDACDLFHTMELEFEPFILKDLGF